MWLKFLSDVKNHKAGECVDIADAEATGLLAMAIAEKSEAPAALATKATEITNSLKTFVQTQVEDGINAGFDRLSKEFGDTATATKSKRPGAGRITTHDNIEDDPNRGWKSIGEQVAMVKRYYLNDDVARADERIKYLQGIQTKAGPTVTSNEGFGPDGGFLLAPNFANQILGWQLDEEALLGLSDNYTTASNSLTVPVDETTPWSTDGVQAYWTAEGGQITQSKPKLGQDNIILQKLSVLVPVTDEMVTDSFVGIGQYVGQKAGSKIKFATNQAFIAGTGAGTPLGFANSGAIVTQAKETNQTAATVNLDNLANMYSRLPNMSGRSLRWLMHPSVMPQMVKITNGNNSLYIGPGEIENKRGRLATLLGIPIIVSQHCQVLGTQGDIYLVDWSQYLTLTKGDGVQAAMSIHLYFDYNVSTFRFNFRVGGQPWPKSTIASLNGTYPLSPFVQLATRA